MWEQPSQLIVAYSLPRGPSIYSQLIPYGGVISRLRLIGIKVTVSAGRIKRRMLSNGVEKIGPEQAEIADPFVRPGLGTGARTGGAVDDRVEAALLKRLCES